MRPHHRFPVSCVLMLWDWTALNGSANTKSRLTYDATQRSFRFALCFSLRVFPANSDTVCSLAVIRRVYVLYLLPLFVSYYRLNITITRAHVYTRIHRVIKKSTYIRIRYLRAPLFRKAVSRSCNWSPWTRWMASEVSRLHRTWFFLRVHLKVVLYHVKLQSTDHLKERIRDAYAHITPDVVRRERGRRIRMWYQCNVAHKERVL